MSDLHFIHTTVGSREAGLKLGHELVEKKLVACVNVGEKITSVYPWAGEIQEEQEIPLSMKTTESCLTEAMNVLELLHPYDCPEVLTTRIDQSSENYADWVHEHCG